MLRPHLHTCGVGCGCTGLPRIQRLWCSVKRSLDVLLQASYIAFMVWAVAVIRVNSSGIMFSCTHSQTHVQPQHGVTEQTWEAARAYTSLSDCRSSTQQRRASTSSRSGFKPFMALLDRAFTTPMCSRICLFSCFSRMFPAVIQEGWAQGDRGGGGGGHKRETGGTRRER